MPRGIKNKDSYEDQLKKIDERIAKYQKCLETLAIEREDIAKKKEAADIQALYQYMQQNEISVQQVLAALAPTKERLA